MRFKETVVVVLLLSIAACKGRRAQNAVGEGDEDGIIRPRGTIGIASSMPSLKENLKKKDTTDLEDRIWPDDFETWYRITGRARTGIPVILIHDGPGLSSFPLKSLEALNNERPVIRYDQHGSGRSRVDLNPDHFLRDTYLAELDSVRTRGEYPMVHLVTHGWGAVIALAYRRKHPDAVASITFISPVIDYPQLRESIKRRLATLPDSLRRLIIEPPKLFTIERKDYQYALTEFGRRFNCCQHAPPQADFDSTRGLQNDSIVTMLKGNLLLDGQLANYRASPLLDSVKAPTLFITGDRDVSDTTLIRRYARATPGSQMVVLPNVSHFPTWDARDETLSIIRDFLHSADRTVHERIEKARVAGPRMMPVPK